MRNEVKRKWDQCLCRLPTPLKGLVNSDEGGRGDVAHLWLLSKELWQTSVVLRRGNGNEVEHCCAAPTRIRSWSCCKQLEGTRSVLWTMPEIVVRRRSCTLCRPAKNNHIIYLFNKSQHSRTASTSA